MPAYNGPCLPSQSIPSIKTWQGFCAGEKPSPEIEIPRMGNMGLSRQAWDCFTSPQGVQCTVSVEWWCTAEWLWCTGWQLQVCPAECQLCWDPATSQTSLLPPPVLSVARGQSVKMWGKTPLSCYVTVRTQHYVIYMTARPHIKMTNSQFERLRDSCLQKGDLYQDPDFPASQASVFYHQKPPFNFVWKRPKVS